MKKFSLLAFAVAAIQLTGCTSGGVDTPPPSGSGGQSNFSVSNSSSTDVGNQNDGPGQSLSSQVVASSSVATGGSEVPEGDVVTGKALFDSPVYGCVDCHGVFGESMGDASHYPIDPDKEIFEVEGEQGQSKQQMNLVKYIKENMPPKGTAYEQCSESCASNVAAYIKSWKKKDQSSSEVSSVASSDSSVAVSSQAPSSAVVSSQSSIASSVPVVVSSSSQVPVSSAASSVSSVASSVAPASSSSSQQSQVMSSSSSESVVASSSSADTSSSEPVEVVEGDAVNGKALYDNGGFHCAVCHGPTGENEKTPIDPSKEFFTKEGDDAQYTLAEYINNFMPSPGVCEGDCAEDIAAYIKTWVEESSSSQVVESSSSEDLSSSSSSDTQSSEAQSSEAPQSSSSEASSAVSESSEGSNSSEDSSVVVSSEPTSSSEDAQSSSSSEESSSSEAHVADIEVGKALYESNQHACATCHGDDGQSTSFKVIDPTRESYQYSESNQMYALEEYIELYMPTITGMPCIGTCAIDVAAYIRSWADEESSSSSAAQSDSSSQDSSSSVAAGDVVGLEYYFSMNHGSGATLQDDMGNSDDGAIDNATWVDGRDGKALDFNGNAYVEFDSVDIGSPEMTISAWIKPDSQGQEDEGRIISKAAGYSEDDHNWMLAFAEKGDGKVYLRFRLRSVLTDTQVVWTDGDEVNMGEWNHVAVTYDGSLVTIYINGEVAATSTVVIGDVDSNPNMPVTIGNNPGGGRGFDGIIDEVRIYSRALNESDIENELMGMFGQISGSDSSSNSSSTSSESQSEPEEQIPDEIIPIIEQPFKATYSCTNEDARGASQDIYRRLTHKETLNALTALFGEGLLAQAESELALLPDEVHGFDAELFSSALTSSHLNAINSISGVLAEAAANDSDFIAKYTNCDALDTEDCVAQMVENFGSRAVRRPLSNQEVNHYVGLYSADTEMEVSTLIHAFLLSPEFNLHVEFGELSGDRYRLTAFEVASRVSFRTTGSIPDETLWHAALNGELETMDQIRAHVDRLFASDLGKEYIRSFFRNWMEIEESAQVAVSDAYRDGVEVNTLYADALDDFDKFVDYIVWNRNGTLTDMFHDTSVFPQTTELANVYGSGTWTDGAPLVAGSGHKGLLLRPATLIGGNNHTSIILRGVMVRRRLLCDILPTPSQDIVNARDDSGHPDELNHEVHPNRDVVKNLTKSDTCMSCHALINPLAFAMENFDSLGRFQAIESVFSESDELIASHEINTVSYYPEIEDGGTNALMDGDDLVSALTASSKLKSCFATQLYRFQRYRHEEQADYCGLNETETLVGEGDGTILDVFIKNVANEDIFWRGN